MNATVRLGTIRGLTVGLHWSVLIIAALVAWSLGAGVLPDAAPGYHAVDYWMAAAAGACVLLGSILAHEVSHAVVARRAGVKVNGITLWMLGGVSTFDSAAPDAHASLRIAVAGPAMSVAIAAASMILAVTDALLGGPELVVATLGWVATINVVLAVFNMLPGAPLDGGRVLAAVLWLRSGDEHASNVKAAKVGRFVGQGLIGLGILDWAFGAGVGGLWLMLIGWFLTSAARAEQAEETAVGALAGVRVSDVMSREVRTAAAHWTVDEFVRTLAASSPVSSFPVIGHNGEILGLVTLRQIKEHPRELWPGTTLGDLAVPAEQLTFARPDDLLVEAVRLARRSAGRILVVDEGRLVGIVTPADVSRALERAELVHSVPQSRSR